jgi:hypothetical protein
MGPSEMVFTLSRDIKAKVWALHISILAKILIAANLCTMLSKYTKIEPIILIFNEEISQNVVFHINNCNYSNASRQLFIFTLRYECFGFIYPE